MDLVAIPRKFYVINNFSSLGAHYISYSLISGAQKAGSLLNQGTPKLIDHIQPEAQQCQVDPNLAQGLRVAKYVTSGAAQVTGYLGELII